MCKDNYFVATGEPDLLDIPKRLEKVHDDFRVIHETRLHERYAQRASAYFHRWVRAIQPILFGVIEPEFEDLLYDRLLDTEVVEILQLKLILRGRPHPPICYPEIFLAIQLSVTIEEQTIQQALTRASLLRKAGLPVVAVVGGEYLDKQLEERTYIMPILVAQRECGWGWERALAANQPPGGQKK